MTHAAPADGLRFDHLTLAQADGLLAQIATRGLHAAAANAVLSEIGQRRFVEFVCRHRRAVRSAMLSYAHRNTEWGKRPDVLPAMTPEQRRLYEKLRPAVGRDAALAEAGRTGC